jgi:protein-disulfide isomerase/uncharacterized membrane protein
MIPPMSVKRSALITLALALAGVVVSILIARTHTELSAGLAAGCKFNETINCAPVLGSEYAYLFGIPVAYFALAAYAGMAVLALGAYLTASVARRRQAANLLLLGAVVSVIVSAYLAYVAFAIIGHVCPQCTTLYIINLLLLAATAWLTSAVQGSTREQQTWQGRLRLIGGGVVGTLALLVAAVAWKGLNSPTAMSADEVCQRDPQFCSQYKNLPVVPLDVPGGHVKGRPDAPVTIVEFSDFQCPYCSRVVPSIDKVLETYGDQVRVVFRQFPLNSIHPMAQKAAEASLCANEQGKFWELHDAMFANQKALGVDQLKTSAAGLGVNADQFNTCLDGGKYAPKVAADLAEGSTAGVSGTPAMFVNGRFLSGAVPFETLAGFIDDELRRKGITPKKAG